jgi:uncharacterized membrane protein
VPPHRSGGAHARSPEVPWAAASHPATSAHSATDLAPARLAVDAAGTWRRNSLAGYIVALVLIASLLPVATLWAAQLVLVLLLLTVPGLLLLRTLRVPWARVKSFPVYVPAASLVVLLMSGLLVDLIGLATGPSTPLRPLPLLVGFEVVCLGLLWASWGAPASCAISWGSIWRPPMQAAPLILPLVAVAGALRLNNGHGNAVALLAASASLVTLLVAVALAPKISKTILAVILYAVALAIIWSFSLRGSGLYGFDIAAEYYEFHQTVMSGIWHTAHTGSAGAYGAMLSLTVLPAELHFLTGVQTLLVFKVLYPAIFALFPVAVYSLAHRVISRRWALIAAATVITQSPFMQEMVALARQEIALIFFAAMMGVLLDRHLPRSCRLLLGALFGMAMAVSHYSTAYLAIMAMGLAVPLQWAVSWFRPIARWSGALVLITGVTLATAIVWYGPVTHSTANLSGFSMTLDQQGLNMLPNATRGENLIAAYLNGNTATTITPSNYAERVRSYYAAHESFVSPLPDAGLAKYQLQKAVVPAQAVRWPFGQKLATLGQLVAQQLITLLAGVGALLMISRRRVSLLTRMTGGLALAAVLFLVVIRLSGTLAAAYNQERALLQELVVVAIAVAWTMQGLAGRGRLRRFGVLTLAIGLLGVIFMGNSGLTNAIVGGSLDTNLANSGEDFERFYVSAPELASASWLGAEVRPGQLVYADEYGRLRLATVMAPTEGVLTDITPLTLNKHAWVYASRTNVVNHSARAVYGNSEYVVYLFPSAFLDQNYNLVYTDGSSEVFHR